MTIRIDFFNLKSVEKNNQIKFFILVFLSFISLFSRAQSSLKLPVQTAPAIPPASGVSVYVVPKDKNSLLSTQKINLKMMTDSIDNSQIEAQYLYDNKSGDNLTTSSVQLKAGHYLDTDFNYFVVPAAFYSKKLKILDDTGSNISKNNLEIAIGRKKSSSSFLDDEFSLGLINSYFTQDYINYTAEGLTGLHTNTNIDNIKLGLNFYPLFIPNQGPGVQEKNGQLQTANTWGQKAPETFMYNGKENSITYKIDNYDLTEIINQPGYSAQIQIGDLKKNNLEFSLSYSDTPINDIVLSRSLIADLNLNGSVKIYPVVRYSDKIYSDIKHSFKNATFFLSYLSDKPRNKVEKDDRAVQFLAPIQGYGAGFKIDFNEVIQRPFTVSASYARFYGGDISDINSDSSQNTFSIANDRLIYREPFKLTANAEIFKLGTKPFFMTTTWIYDSAQQGSLLSLVASHSPLLNLNLALGADVIGTNTPEADDTDTNNKSFLQSHRSDDRVTGAIEYVF